MSLSRGLFEEQATRLPVVRGKRRFEISRSKGAGHTFERSVGALQDQKVAASVDDLYILHSW